MNMRQMLAAIGTTRVDQDHVRMFGGLDQMTPPMERKPGTIRLMQNFECDLNGGYTTSQGYERFDGRAKPSAAQYAILSATITGSAALGNTLVGVTSAATGIIIALPGGAFVLTKISGTFQSGETLNIGGSPVATATSAAVIGGASSGLLNAQYLNLAADSYRSDIAAVPGSGKILGVWLFNDVLYAFRNNAGGTAAALYKSTSSGWSLVAFEYEVTFSAGSGAATIVDGGTLTQGGVTATIRRVLVRTGSLAGGTATGTMVIAAPAGGNFAAGAATVGAGTLTLAGIQTAITMQPSGRFEFITTNFGGAITSNRMYGCDGVNRAFEFDGTYFVPIPTGMAADTPNHIFAHKKHLFLSFVGSVQHSGTVAPYAWTPVLGASEIAMGDTVNAFAGLPGNGTDGGALAILTRNRASILYGSSSADWVLTPYREELGAYPYTAQDIGFTVFLDDRGVTDLQTSQEYGNFAHSALSNRIRTLINEFRPLVTASCISRDKSQYRLFFSNSYAIYLTNAGRKVVGFALQLFAHPVRCACSSEMADGSEVMFFGSDDGMVYQQDRGTSFDGDAIEAYLYLPYNSQGNPRANKRYRSATIEMAGSGYSNTEVGYELGYNSTDLAQPATQNVATSFSSTLWDAFTWDAATWDGQTLAPSTISLEGEAENISFVFRSNADYFAPMTITGLVINHTPRRLLRP